MTDSQKDGETKRWIEREKKKRPRETIGYILVKN